MPVSHARVIDVLFLTQYVAISVIGIGRTAIYFAVVIAVCFHTQSVALIVIGLGGAPL